MITFVLLFSRLPIRCLYVISDIFYFILYYVVRYRQRVVRKNLRNSFPKENLIKLKQIEKGFYRSFCDNIVETIKLYFISDDEIQRMVKFDGLDKLYDVYKSGISIGLFAPHYCNWELLTVLPHLMSKSDPPTLYILYHVLHNKKVDRLMKLVREKNQSICIPKQALLRYIKLTEEARKNAIYGYCFDQSPKWENIHSWINFMNQDTPVFSGAERICRKKRHAVFYIDMYKIARGQYKCKIIPISYDASQTLEGELTAKAFSLLETAIMRQPEYYLWSHKRWKRDRYTWEKLKNKGK